MDQNAQQTMNVLTIMLALDRSAKIPVLVHAVLELIAESKNITLSAPVTTISLETLLFAALLYKVRSLLCLISLSFSFLSGFLSKLYIRTCWNDCLQCHHHQGTLANHRHVAQTPDVLCPATEPFALVFQT